MMIVDSDSCLVVSASSIKETFNCTCLLFCISALDHQKQEILLLRPPMRVHPIRSLPGETLDRHLSHPNSQYPTSCEPGTSSQYVCLEHPRPLTDPLFTRAEIRTLVPLQALTYTTASVSSISLNMTT